MALSYSFQSAKDADSKEKLTNSPSHIMKLGLMYPVFKHFYATSELRYESERITVYGTRTDPYLATNIHLSTKPLFDHVRFSLLVRNMFDISYELPGSYEHIQHAIPQDGRNSIVKLEYTF